MPTSTFPRWWNQDTILQLLNAARDGASYRDLDGITNQGSGRVRSGQLRAWVRYWQGHSSDRPQARLAAAIAAYGPPSSRESAAMRVVESALALHRVMCECGQTKDDPGDAVLRCLRGARGAAAPPFRVTCWSAVWSGSHNTRYGERT